MKDTSSPSTAGRVTYDVTMGRCSELNARTRQETKGQGEHVLSCISQRGATLLLLGASTLHRCLVAPVPSPRTSSCAALVLLLAHAYLIRVPVTLHLGKARPALLCGQARWAVRQTNRCGGAKYRHKTWPGPTFMHMAALMAPMQSIKPKRRNIDIYPTLLQPLQPLLTPTTRQTTCKRNSGPESTIRSPFHSTPNLPPAVASPPRTPSFPVSSPSASSSTTLSDNPPGPLLLAAFLPPSFE